MAAGDKHKDFLTDLDVDLPGGTDLSWEMYEELVWNKVFEKQYQFATNEKDSPLHHCIAKKFRLKNRCQQNKLIPIQCDEQIPTTTPGAIQTFTRLSSKFWTTSWAGAQGSVVRETKTDLQDIQEQLMKATIIDKKELDPELEKELKTAIDTELENLGEKACEDDASPTATFLALMKKMDQLEESMKQAPPDRMGQYMQCREIQSDYVDRLGVAMKAQAILEQGQVNIYELINKYKSKTEILWWDLQKKNNYTSCLQLDGPTLAEGFEYEGLVPDEVAGKGTMFKAPPPMAGQIASMVKNLIPVESDTAQDIDDCKDEIARLEQEKKDCKTPEEKKENQRALRREQTKLKHLKGFSKNIVKQGEAVHNSVDNSFAQAQKCEEMQKQMAEALDKNREAFEKFADGTTAMKAVWRAKDPENPGSSFETKVVTETFAMQKSKSTINSSSTQVTAGASAGGGFWGFSCKVSGSVAHGSQQSHMQGQDEAKQTVFHFECEGCYGILSNPLMDTVLRAFRNDQWFIEGQKPGNFWKQDGLSIRFYVAEIFFARKLMFKTSDTEATNEIQANTSASSNSASWSVEAGYWGVTGGTSGSVAHANSKTDQESSMEKSAKDEALYHGNLYIKFLLLKPVLPAPKRESADPKELDWAAPEYAKTHLGMKKE